jgi:hypothetical protein
MMIPTWAEPGVVTAEKQAIERAATRILDLKFLMACNIGLSSILH